MSIGRFLAIQTINMRNSPGGATPVAQCGPDGLCCCCRLVPSSPPGPMIFPPVAPTPLHQQVLPYLAILKTVMGRFLAIQKLHTRNSPGGATPVFRCGPDGLCNCCCLVPLASSWADDLSACLPCTSPPASPLFPFLSFCKSS
jgi:hypothetical protein